jgi:hypothetical protein
MIFPHCLLHREVYVRRINRDKFVAFLALYKFIVDEQSGWLRPSSAIRRGQLDR